MNLLRPFWNWLARKLARHGGLSSPQQIESLEEKIKRLENFRFRTERRAGGGSFSKVFPGTALAQFESDEACLRAAWQLREEKENLEGIKLLEAAMGKAKQPEVFRAFQACFAYEKSWDHDTIRFLREAVKLIEPKRDTLLWGPAAILTNAYWSRAMTAAGRSSKTIMWDYATINQRDDFDLYVEELIPDWLLAKNSERPMERLGSLPSFLAFLYVIRHASVVHIPMTGLFLAYLRIWREEAPLLREAGIKVVAMPYGGDYYCYSRVEDPSLRYGLLASYPEMARREDEIQEKLTYWQKEADCVLSGYMVDAMGRWDVTIFTFFHIDTARWEYRGDSSQHDGRNGPVKVLHTPNHRGFKGTEFLVEAVRRLKEKGLQVELVLLEKVSNDRVRELMQECDILAEQFIATAYALSGLEGMASGLPVLANLDSEYYTRVYRRYSFLNECPILSTTPETLERNLEILITHPSLRTELGRAGRAFVEKYHSFSAAQFLFGKIYERLLEDRDVDLIDLYHPIKSEFARSHAPVEHPLVENRLPEDSPHLS